MSRSGFRAGPALLCVDEDRATHRLDNGPHGGDHFIREESGENPSRAGRVTGAAQLGDVHAARARAELAVQTLLRVGGRLFVLERGRQDPDSHTPPTFGDRQSALRARVARAIDSRGDALQTRIDCRLFDLEEIERG
jgi:hypothetical protein